MRVHMYVHLPTAYSTSFVLSRFVSCISCAKCRVCRVARPAAPVICVHNVMHAGSHIYGFQRNVATIQKRAVCSTTCALSNESMLKRSCHSTRARGGLKHIMLHSLIGKYLAYHDIPTPRHCDAKTLVSLYFRYAGEAKAQTRRPASQKATKGQKSSECAVS